MKQNQKQIIDAVTESRLAGGAWIETPNPTHIYGIQGSRLAGGAWIETMRNIKRINPMSKVAPRRGRVD